MLSLLVIQPMKVNADTTEDLLNVYGMTLGGPIRSEIEEQITDAERQLGEALFVQRETESYNRLIEQYTKERARQQSAIISEATSYLNQMDKYAVQIESSILSADISDLLKYDSNYKSCNRYADTLIDSLDYYQSYYDYKTNDIDIDKIVDKVQVARQLYSESIDAVSIGEIKNIKFIMPIERRVNSSYGMRIDPIKRTQIRFHSGTDYYAQEGTPVYALLSGKVISAGWSNSVGNFITVQSSENIKYYICHLSEIQVEVGEQIQQYQQIALSGNTGSSSTGAHLHIALYINGVSYDVDKLYTQNLK